MLNKRHLDIIILICVMLSTTGITTFIFIHSENIQNASSTPLNFNSEENIQNGNNTVNEGNIYGAFPEAEKYFPFGTNIIYETIGQLANLQGIDKIKWIEDALDDMQAHHINAIHFNNLNYDDPGGINLKLFHTLAEERGIRLWPQAIGGGGTPYYFPRWLDTTAERDAFFDNIAKPAYTSLIEQYIDSEVILGWGITEEPPASLVPEFKKWTDYIDGLDPNHPAMVLYLTVDSVYAARDYVKPRIIVCDFYPFRGLPSSAHYTPSGSLNYYENAVYDSYVAARDCGAPLWIMGQGFGCWMSSGYWDWRSPTPNEMHMQAWVAIVNGAKGIFYWSYCSTVYANGGGQSIYGLVDRYGNPSDSWDAVNDVWSELEPLTKIIVEIDESDSSIISSMGEGIRARTFQRSEGTEKYVIVVNTDIENNKVTNLELTSTENIYDLTTLEQVSSDQLFNHMLLPGRGNIYLVGSEEDFNRYLGDYNRTRINGYDKDTDSINLTIPFNPYDLYIFLIVSGIISLVLIIIKRRLSSKQKKSYKRHKHYIYKY